MMKNTNHNRYEWKKCIMSDADGGDTNQSKPIEQCRQIGLSLFHVSPVLSVFPTDVRWCHLSFSIPNVRRIFLIEIFVFIIWWNSSVSTRFNSTSSLNQHLISTLFDVDFSEYMLEVRIIRWFIGFEERCRKFEWFPPSELALINMFNCPFDEYFNWRLVHWFVITSVLSGRDISSFVHHWVNVASPLLRFGI